MKLACIQAPSSESKLVSRTLVGDEGFASSTCENVGGGQAGQKRVKFEQNFIQMLKGNLQATVNALGKTGVESRCGARGLLQEGAKPLQEAVHQLAKSHGIDDVDLIILSNREGGQLRQTLPMRSHECQWLAAWRWWLGERRCERNSAWTPGSRLRSFCGVSVGKPQALDWRR